MTLRYIIDNYDKLPDVAIFLHGRRYQWHNEDPLYGTFPFFPCDVLSPTAPLACSLFLVTRHP